MEYKVIKPFGAAKKGDVFRNKFDGTDFLFTMNKTDIYKNGDSETIVNMTMNKTVIDELVEKGYLLEIKPEAKAEEKLKQIEGLIEDMLETYDEDYKAMLEAFEDGDVQPCVKIEAETVYFNLTKVLKAIKTAIHE